jgi:hypothetical protein
LDIIDDYSDFLEEIDEKGEDIVLDEQEIDNMSNLVGKFEEYP